MKIDEESDNILKNRIEAREHSEFCIFLQPRQVNMHPIAEKFFALASEGKKEVHIAMAKLALESWNKHLASGNVPLAYQETVAGTHQEVDSSLPADAIEAVIYNTASEYQIAIASQYVPCKTMIGNSMMMRNMHITVLTTHTKNTLKAKR